MTFQDVGLRPLAAVGEAAERRGWSAAELAAGMGGQWAGDAPGPGWRAMGVCIYPPEMQPGDVVVVRGMGATGVALPSVPRLPFIPQAVVLERDAPSAPGVKYELRVDYLRTAVLAMGRYARQASSARVIGVTGSAGKTTMVAMLSHILGLWGVTGSSRASANLQIGIAWNLASMPRDAAFLVVEMAIGGMARNTALVRPDVAIITNIAPAHLEYHDNVDEIARRKARIFDGMSHGGVAVIFADMPQYDIFANAARSAGLRIVSYGRHPGADIRLVNYVATDRLVELSVRGRALLFRNGAPGEHMALNAAGCVAVLDALGASAEAAGPFFSLFRPVRGRGEVIDAPAGDGCVRVVDESYNANPASMAAALQLLQEISPPVAGGRRVLALGDMLELGPDSAALHAGLKPHVEACSADLILLCGEQMAALRDVLESRAEVVWSPTAAELLPRAGALLRSGDLLLVKGSAGVRISELVRALRERQIVIGA